VPLATGEEPLAQACFLYVLEASVVSLLPAAALHQLLQRISDRCAALLGDSDAMLPRAHAPEAIVLLATMGRVLSAVGNVQAAEAMQVRESGHRLLIAAQPAVSRAAARVLGQLAAVDGASAAQMMSDYLSLVMLQTASLGSRPGSQHGAELGSPPASAGVLSTCLCCCQCFASSGGAGADSLFLRFSQL
jgi:hypothetical protein